MTVLACVGGLTGCAAKPGPAPIAEDTQSKDKAQSTVDPTPEVPADKKNRDEIVIGIDPLSNGFNPHLIADDTVFIQALANLTLPSAFYGKDMNADMLSEAKLIDPAPGAAQTVRYRIKEEAQWSDGAPITAADFTYLWTNLKTEAAANDAAGYRLISNVRSENGGKVVYVDFAKPVHDWQSLFQHLLPSHLFSIGTESFDRVLMSTIPASGGKYMVRTVDRKRGVVELGRNDRFWGANPAQVELLTFREVSSPAQAVQMLRNQQIGYLDITPTETAVDSLTLVGGGEVRTRSLDSTLQLGFNTAALPDEQVRRGLAGLIDVPQIARLAAGRSAELDIVATMPVNPEAVDAAKAHFKRPLKIAADPADTQATAAAQTAAAQLRAAGLSVEVVATDFADLTRKRIPERTVDITVYWAHQPHDAFVAATQYGCVDAALKTVGGNLTSWCAQDTESALQKWMETGDSTVFPDVDKQMQERAVIVPIMRDRRVEALSPGIQGPAPALKDWPTNPHGGALDTVATWRKKNS